MATIGALSRESSAVASAAAADTVRHDDARLTDARTPSAHAANHAAAGSDPLTGYAPTASPTLTGLVSVVRLVRAPQTVTYAATVTIDAATGDAFAITATGALTLAVPTNPSNGQMIVVEVLASGAARTVTLNASIVLTTGLTTSLSVASGETGIFAFRRSTLAGSVWICTTMTQTI